MSQSCSQPTAPFQCLDGWWMYYGIDGVCNYDSTTLQGELVTPWIDLPTLPSGGSIVLDHCEVEDTECEVEQYWLRVEERGGPTTSYWIRCSDDAPPYDLTPFAGRTVRIHWDFDAVDTWLNGSLGILIDNVTITAYEGGGGDCNGNLIPDHCDIAAGTSGDCDSDGVPDECQGQGGSFCVGSLNSTGKVALMHFSGTRILSCNDLVLSVEQAPPHQVGLFFFGSKWTTGTPFGEGILCVSGSTYRLLPAVFLDATGSGSHALDFAAPPAAGVIQPGSTWYFQFWYRDPLAVGYGHNLSKGLWFTFAP